MTSAAPRSDAWRLLGRAAFYLLVVLITFFCLFPFYFAIVTSLKSGTELFSSALVPAAPAVKNYTALFSDAEQPFGRHIVNSLGVAFMVVAASLFLGVTAAYALGRIAFRGKGLVLLTVLAVSMFPQVAVLSGMFELMQSIGFYNHWWGLALPYMIFTLPFTVWVLTTFVRDLPKELEEAAIMDGCAPAAIIGKVFLPLMWPALVTTGLLAFIAAWNEFLFALTFVLDNSQRTVPVSISLISGADKYEIPWGKIMAASVLVTLPLIALVLVFQRKIIGGLTSGAVKG
ncbi:MAG: carbohydrate ABC transporter permease [Pseudomonadota bacterium]|nr:carbohydrate ABC transporter permease [Pseudomonadota bacterium]